MVVTVSFENSHSYNNKNIHLDNTVSSGPVGRRSTGMVEESTEISNEAKKKWSIGKLFRRKKKESDSEASSGSSDENSQKYKVKRKKISNKKRTSTPKSNEYVNIHVQSKRSQSVTKVPPKEYYDEGILSDPSAGFIGYVGRGIPRSPFDHYRYKGQLDSLEKRGPNSSCGSQDGSLKKGRKNGIKARAEAKRNFRNDTSSDEESQKSTSSSIMKFKSDNSLANHSKEGSISKRSRSARNDRYIKRLSRDEENQSREVETIQKYLGRTEADVMALKQRVLSTPQIHNTYGKIYKETDYSEPNQIKKPYDAKKSLSGTQLAGYANVPYTEQNDRNFRHKPALSTSNSSMYSYPSGVINFSAQVNNENISYSIPYNTNKQPKVDILPNRPNFRRSTSVEHNGLNHTSPNYENDVMVVKLPLGVPRRENVAPPPPPRDPQRKVPTPLSYMYDNVRPLSGSYEISNHRVQRPPNVTTSQNNIYENGCVNNKQVNGLSWSKRPISSSEDHIAVQLNCNNPSNIVYNGQPQRPSSVTGEMHSDIYNRYVNRPPINQIIQPQRSVENPVVNSEFVYFADKTPRSRRPIHIAPTNVENEQLQPRDIKSSVSQPRSASDFWKKLDNQECQKRRHFGHNRALSDQSVAINKCSQRVQTSMPSPLKTQSVSVQTRANGSFGENLRTNEMTNGVRNNSIINKENKPVCYSSIDIIPMDDVRRKSRSSEESSIKRKSTNLEDALSELEAIYNSLGLGDEDLLDRAERQESLAPKSSNINYTNDYSEDVHKRLSLNDKKSTIPDKVHDDMAYRRLNPHERPKSKDVSNLVPQVSYMLSSPILTEPIVNGKKNIIENEPDVVYDDVVYRNIKQANNYLKIDDPQPPFGIPIGPITPAPNSDYLHAVPEKKVRSRYIPHNSPDIVTDDLAFRALRKDCKTVSPINRELTGSIHNTNSDNANLSRPSKIFDNHVIKKKRAVRSLSANIFTIIQKEIDEALNMCNEQQALEKSQSIPDLAEAINDFAKNCKLTEEVKTSRSIHAPKIVDTLIKTKPDNTKETSSGKVNEELRSKFFGSPIVNESLDSSQYTNNLLDLGHAKGKDNISSIKDDLDVMAEEAKETSAKLVIALEELQKDRLSNQFQAIQKKDESKIELNTKEKNIQSNPKVTTESNLIIDIQKNSDSLTDTEKDIPKKLDLSTHILHSPSNIKIKGTIPAHIKEKMEEFSRPKREQENNNIQISDKNLKDSYSIKTIIDNNNRSKGEHTEDSLLTISNQLNIAGSALKNNSEQKCDIFEDEGKKLRELASKCSLSLECKNKDLNTISNIEIEKPNQIHHFTVHTRNLEHDNSKVLNSKNDCLSPESKNSYINEIENLNKFDDLRKGISELLEGIGSINDKLNLPKELPTDVIKSPKDNFYQDEDKIILRSEKSEEEEMKNNRESPEYNSSEELAMIFHLNEETPVPSTSKQDICKLNDSHMDLSSPRLVKNANQSLRKMSLDEGIHKNAIMDVPSKKHSQPSNEIPNSEVPWRKYRRSSVADNVNKGNILNKDHRSGVKRPSEEVTSLSGDLSSSAFQPFQSRRFVTETPCSKSKIIKEKPFFEDIRIIARGFGDIIEYPHRRGCVQKNNDSGPQRRSPDDDNRYFKRVRLSQDLTKAAYRKGGVWRARNKLERRATTHGDEGQERKEFYSIVEPNFYDTNNCSIQGTSVSIASDLKLPQTSNDTRHSKSESVLNIDSFVNSDLSFNNFVQEERLEEDFSYDSDVSEEDIEMSSGVINDDLGRVERMKKYKEERRKQLALQNQKHGATITRRSNRKNPTTSTVDNLPPENGPTEQKTVGNPSTAVPVIRTTRASRLRAAAATAVEHPPTTRRAERKSSEAKQNNTSRNNSVSFVENNSLVMSVPCDTVLAPVSDNIVLLQSNQTSGNKDGVECAEGSAVIKSCDSLKGKAPSLEEAARDKENNKQATTSVVSCQRRTNSGQSSKPSSSSSAKDSTNDEISSRRGRTASSRPGNKTDSDSTNELPSTRTTPSSSVLSSLAVTRRTPPRSSSSPRSSSHSPQSPYSQKLQYKRTSVDINAKLPLTTNTSNERVEKSTDKKNRTKDCSTEIRSLDVKSNEQSRINKRLNSSIADSSRHIESSKSKKEDKMTPGVENDYLLNCIPGVNLDKGFSITSSVNNSSSSNIDKIRANNSRLSSRMDALAALTKETLARVDRLTKMNHDPHDKNKSDVAVTNGANNDDCKKLLKREMPNNNANKTDKLPTCTTKQVSDRLNDIDKVTEHLLDFERKNALGSFSKQGNSKKSSDLSTNQLSYTPVSILKRKSLQEEHGISGQTSSTVSTPPVTFSPSVIDPIPSKSKARSLGILKKRRSLDESHVHRRRSCSPEGAFADDYNLDTRPILKSQRRSSLEEVIRGRSPDGHIHGILKRKTSRDSEPLSGDRSLGSPEPQGILKRKSNSSSSSSTTSSHVSIAQAVILAAAGGAEIIDDKESVKPILKKKSISEDRQSFDFSDGPKPILKKKSLTESDDNDLEKRKKPILKSSRKISMDDGNTSSFDLSEDDRGSRRSSVLKHRTPENSECESGVRPILKHVSRDHSQSPRPRLSFCSDDEKALVISDENVGQHFVSPSLSLLRRLETERTSDDEEEIVRPSRLESGRLQSPSKLKEYFDTTNSNQPHHPSVVLKRREERPVVANRSKSLASNSGDELDIILRSRRISLNDESGEPSTSQSRGNIVEDGHHTPKFPSIAERIKCMQRYMGVDKSNDQGAIPKKRSAIGRYKTQPITVEELQNISSLELRQADFQRLTGQSSSSSTGDTDAPSVSTVDSGPNKVVDNNTSEEVKSTAEDNLSSPDQSSSCDNFKFKNYSASPSFNNSSNKLVSNSRSIREPDNLSTSEVKPFDRVVPSAGSPEYRPNILSSITDNSEKSQSSERQLNEAAQTPEINPSSESTEVDSSFSENFVPSPQSYKYKKLIGDDFSYKTGKGSKNSSVRISNGSVDFDIKDSPTTSEFNRIFKESARNNFTQFDSLDFSNLDFNSTINTSASVGENVALVKSFTELSFNVDKKPEENTPPVNKAERPTSLFNTEVTQEKDSREAARQELDQLEIGLEDVINALDADTCALAGADVDVWSLNVSIDSGVFNRMSSGDSGPLSAEDLSLPQDFSRKPDIVRDHQPPSLIADKLTSPPIDVTLNKFNMDDKVQDIISPVHIHKQPKMDTEYLQKKEDYTKRDEDVKASLNETPKDMDDDEDKCDEPVNSPEQLFGLMKSNSVSARASMWQQLHQQANKAAVKPVLRHSRSRAKEGCPSILDRFKTQPITMGEVNDAANSQELLSLNQSKSSFNLSVEQDEEAKLDDNDPAKLTLAEKMKLFGSTVSHRPPTGAMKKPRSPRFQTMPVLANHVDDALLMNKLKLDESNVDICSPKNKIMKLSTSVMENNDQPSKEDAYSVKKNVLAPSASVDVIPDRSFVKVNKAGDETNNERSDIGANFRDAQSKLAEQASKMLTTEVKGILKSRSGAIPLLPTGGDQLSPEPVKREPALIRPPYTNGKKKPVSSPYTKGGSSEGLKDEGINSSSDDESPSHSSGSSDDTCSSDSSDELPRDPPRKGSPEHLVRPSKLKSCRTESDVARVLKENSKNDDRGVKLPCMDEMRARRIMERCMVKTNKENANKTRTPIVKKAPMEIKVEPTQHETSVKLKNLRNGIPVMKPIENSNFMAKSLDSSNMPDSFVVKNNGNVNSTKLDTEDDPNYNIPPFMRKFMNPVNKSQSMHVFQSQVLRNQRIGREAGGSGEGSGSDGDSSGGREVRRIINKRRQYRAPQSSLDVRPKEEEDKAEERSVETFGGGLRRSATQPMSAQTAPHRGNTIAERLAALQQSGNNDWRRRIDPKISPEDQKISIIAKNKFNETLNKQAEENKKATQLEPIDLGGEADINKIRSKLEISSQDWKKRVGQHDATLFTVAGKMALDSTLSNVPPASPLASALQAEDKRTPQPNKFRSRRADLNGGIMKSQSTAAVSQPASPKKPGIGDFKRSISVSGVDDMATGTPEQQGDSNIMTKSEDGTLNGNKAGSSVSVPRPDDETFTAFFTSPLQSSNLIPYNNNDIHQPVQNIDLDAIDSASRQLLGRTAVPRVRATRKIGGSSNHLKLRATRIEIKEEYTEAATTGIAEMEVNRLKKDKVAQNSSLAVEALAGLASNEDFTAVNLKKTMSNSILGGNGAERNTSKPLLIHIKGRRKVQVRLIEPVAECINSGDCFVLVTTSHVFCYLGLYSNVIERTRATDIAFHIHNKKDLGCVNCTSVITLDEQKYKTLKHWKQFWSLLGVDDVVEEYTPVPAGSADEDEIYESEMTATNMCYEVVDDMFVPIKNFWGQTPKISMLDPAKILIFDFGSELYVWNGKNTILENRRRAFQLAQELWETGYNYTDCHINPVNIAFGLGARSDFKEMSKSDTKRPDWAMIAKVTQHMETVLFKDKFLDWPDFTRVIKVKEEDETFKGAAEIKSCNVDVMWNREYEDPSLVLEGSHVGRGTQHYDKETMRYFEVKTKSITKWMIQEYDYLKIPTEDLNEFYSGDTYIIRWEYQITVTGRELNGKPSKHNVTGRDRCAYFYWQGKDASANEKGAAALLTIELDHEKGPQVRVTQSNEPPAFLNMFNGHLVVHQGKKGVDKSKHRVYSVRGNVDNESHLVQVPCSMRQLRSRASLVIVDIDDSLIYVWHGCKSLKHTRAVALEAARKLAARKHPDLFDTNVSDVKIKEIKEGDEPKAVIDILGGKRELYDTMVNKNGDESNDITTRLFHFTDLSSQFEAIEILSPLRHESLVTPFPFSQNELYSASQPALFLLDGGDRLWLWQGWWPQQEENDTIDAWNGSHRWQVCRRAAMETVLEYWKLSRPDKPKPEAYMAIAGLEPLAFTNMFDDWHNRDDVAAINIAQGYGVGVDEISVAEQLYQLCCTSFPLAVLRQRPLPDSVDPAHIERYLTDTDFQDTFKMTKEEFYELPAWKQANIKKDLGLF